MEESRDDFFFAGVVSRLQEIIKNEKDPKIKAGWMKELKQWEKMIEKQERPKTRTGYKSFKPSVSPSP